VALDRRRFLLASAAPVAIGAGLTGLVVAPSAATAPAARPLTKARRGVGLGTQQVHWSVGPEEVLLSFDDGPYPALTPTVLDILDRYGIPATFMVCGAFAAAHPDLVREIRWRGHAVGNHTWSHRDLSTLEPTVVRDELQRTHDVLTDLVGDITLFRPPRGQLSGVALQAAAELGYDVLLWSAEELEPLVPGTLAVWHDGLGRGGFLEPDDPERRRRHDDRTAQIAQLPHAIDAALAQGVTFLAAPPVK